MDDGQIIDLYWARSEAAILETANKYSKYCHTIAFNILHNNEDSEECVNDTYMRADAIFADCFMVELAGVLRAPITMYDTSTNSRI